MRILHVISSLAPAFGGPTEVLRGLATAQVDAGHQVTVCTTDRGSPVQEKLPSQYFESFYPDQVILKVFPVTYAPLLLSLPLAQWVRENIRAFDVVHVHGLYRFPPTYSAREACRQRVPYIIRPHGALDPYLYDKSSYSVWFKRLYERWFDLTNLHAAGAVHYTAEEERERASFLGLQSRSFVVPNGLDWHHFRALPPRGGFRMRWGLDDAPLVLFLGRLHIKKGLDLLIPAFHMLLSRIPEARLAIAGPENDDYGQKVRGWVRERKLQQAVHFIGSLHGVDVAQAYVDATVFVLPSYTENFGMTVIEAMACAVPVVISDQVNIHAEVTRAGAGLVTQCDAGEVAAALEELLRDGDRRCAMGEAGRQLVQERYTWPVIVDALVKEYEAVIERHRRAAKHQRVMPARTARGGDGGH